MYTGWDYLFIYKVTYNWMTIIQIQRFIVQKIVDVERFIVQNLLYSSKIYCTKNYLFNVVISNQITLLMLHFVQELCSKKCKYFDI